MKQLIFYYDVLSPYAYMASTRLDALAERYAFDIDCKPVLLAGLLNAHGTKGPAEIPAKHRYIIRDLLRWSKVYDVPFEGAPSHPFNPLLPLRCAVALKNRELRKRFSYALLSACWGKSEDITDPTVLKRLLVQSSANPDATIEAASSDEVKSALKTQTEEALQAGVFGVPTFSWNGELFWGNDRLDFLERHIAGKDTIHEEQFQRIMARPATAKR